MSQLLKWMAFGSHFIWRGLSENYLTGWTIISRPLLWAQMTLDFSRYVPTSPVYLFLFLFPFLSSHTQTLLFLSEINTFSCLKLMPLCSHVSELYLCILLQALAPYLYMSRIFSLWYLVITYNQLSEAAAVQDPQNMPK